MKESEEQKNQFNKDLVHITDVERDVNGLYLVYFASVKCFGDSLLVENTKKGSDKLA